MVPQQRNSTPVLVKPWHCQKNNAQPLVHFTHILCTDIQTHTHVFNPNGSSRYSLSFYKVSTLYPLPTQSNPHEFHLHPNWPWTLLHWLPEVHPLTCMPLKHCLKILINNQNIRFEHVLLQTQLALTLHCPLWTCRQYSFFVNSHSLDKQYYIFK